MYATQDDIVTLYSLDALVVADRDGDGVVDEAAVTRALRSASSEINGYIGVRYALPLAEPHDLLMQYCVDIALYRLALSIDVVSETHRTRYDDAISALKRIGKGEMFLDIATPDSNEIVDASGPNLLLSSGPDRLFSRDKMRDI